MKGSTLHNVLVYKAGAITYFFLTLKVEFSKVDVVTKFYDSMIFKLKKKFKKE